MNNYLDSGKDELNFDNGFDVFQTEERSDFLTLFDLEVPNCRIQKEIFVKRPQQRWTAKSRKTQHYEGDIYKVPTRKIKTGRSARKQMGNMEPSDLWGIIYSQSPESALKRGQCISLMKKKSKDISQKLKNRNSSFWRTNYLSFSDARKSMKKGNSFNFLTLNPEKNRIDSNEKKKTSRRVCSHQVNMQMGKNKVNFHPHKNSHSQIQDIRHTISYKKLYDNKGPNILYPNLTSTLLKNNRKNSLQKKTNGNRRKEEKQQILCVQKDELELGVGYTTKKLSLNAGNANKNASTGFMHRNFVEKNMNLPTKRSKLTIDPS